MADSILKKARARRDAALQEAHIWEEFIRRYEELKATPAPAAPPLFAMPDIEASLQAAVRERENKRLDGRTPPPDSELAKTIAVVDAVLDERGQPVLLHELYDEVTRRGLAISGKSPRANLGARLSNAGKYVSLDKKTGWWFKDRPCPAGASDTSESEVEPKDKDAKEADNGELFDAPWGNAA
ncbi:MAG TPA: hypothetical protein VE993_19190 [Stellaceae bacterium]|nr:hypothetical protein [Stellaceae bacterium]